MATNYESLQMLQIGLTVIDHKRVHCLWPVKFVTFVLFVIPNTCSLYVRFQSYYTEQNTNSKHPLWISF